jgi:hypothetical protein
MLISSKFHDYYDTISVFGIDKTCVYQRNRKELGGKFEFADGRRNYSNHWPYEEEFELIRKGIPTKWVVSKYVIGYCGKLYPMILVEKFAPHRTQIFGLYSADEVRDFFAKEDIQLATSRYTYYSIREFSFKSEPSMKQFFEGRPFKALEKEFYDNKCPVFVYGRFGDERRSRRELLVLNPKLKDFRFMRVKDPQTAFQDIFMFISGVLGVSEPVMVELSDKELAKKKGHDGKYSFRKPPGKRGQKKWR